MTPSSHLSSSAVPSKIMHIIFQPQILSDSVTLTQQVCEIYMRSAPMNVIMCSAYFLDQNSKGTFSQEMREKRETHDLLVTGARIRSHCD